MAREFSKSFYNSPAWKSFRKTYFSTHYGICEQCGEIGEEIHHKVFLTPNNISDANITLNEDNCILLCKDCHNTIHEKAFCKSRTKMVMNYTPNSDRYILDDKGNMVERKNVFIVHGAPASGKTTYVKEHMGKYDIVIDLDYISAALTLGDVKADVPDTIPYTLDIRELLYDLIGNRVHYIENAWIIATLPKIEDRQRLRGRLKADLIHIDTCIDICIARSNLDYQRKDKSKQLEIINKYFNDYEA